MMVAKSDFKYPEESWFELFRVMGKSPVLHRPSLIRHACRIKKKGKQKLLRSY